MSCNSQKPSLQYCSGFLYHCTATIVTVSFATIPFTLLPTVISSSLAIYDPSLSFQSRSLRYLPLLTLASFGFSASEGIIHALPTRIAPEIRFEAQRVCILLGLIPHFSEVCFVDKNSIGYLVKFSFKSIHFNRLHYNPICEQIQDSTALYFEQVYQILPLLGIITPIQ